MNITRKLALLLWSIVQPFQLNDDRKSKGESYRASAVLYTYSSTSWVVALKRPSGSSVKLLLESHLEKQESKQQCGTVYYTHSKDQTGMRDLYITHAHTIYRGPEHEGHQQTKSLIVTL